jgi:hypothetical protein
VPGRTPHKLRDDVAALYRFARGGYNQVARMSGRGVRSERFSTRSGVTGTDEDGPRTRQIDQFRLSINTQIRKVFVGRAIVV